jgi:hypothetical protein
MPVDILIAIACAIDAPYTRANGWRRHDKSVRDELNGALSQRIQISASRLTHGRLQCHSSSLTSRQGGEER